VLEASSFIYILSAHDTVGFTSQTRAAELEKEVKDLNKKLKAMEKERDETVYPPPTLAVT
jgi:hypothetical protein